MELVPYSPKGERPLSPFLGREMLYEYVTEQLDPLRMQAMKTLIETDPNLKNELDSLRRALAYCDTLGRVSFASARVDQLRSSENSVDQFLRKSRIYNWPGGVRIGLESLFVTGVVFFFAMMVPWNTMVNVLKENQGTVLLSEVSRELPNSESEQGPAVAEKKLPEDQQASVAKAPNPEQYSDEGMPEDQVPVLANPVEALTQVPVLSEKTLPAPLKKTEAPVAPASKPEPKAEAKERVAGAREPAEARMGFLYKGRLTLTNVVALTPKIAEVVSSLGGRKAGQVPLGWQKGKGSYFHFTIPEAKYEELLNSLKSFGEVKISKDPHDRVMPSGIVRVIIDVEEAATGIKKESVEFVPDPPAADPAAGQ